MSLVLVLGSCAEEFVGPKPASFEELCGHDGPIELLDLDETRVPTGVGGYRYPDGYILTVAYGSTPQDFFRVEVWVVGPCGEHPVLLEDTLQGGQHYEQWPERVFMCTVDSMGLSDDMVALHVDGTSPVLEFEGDENCGWWLPPREVPGGLVMLLADGPTRPLVLQRWTEGPQAMVEKIVLVDDMPIYYAEFTPHGELDGVLAVTPREILAVNTSGELLAVAHDGQGVELLAEGVRQFIVDESGRWIVWQDADSIQIDWLFAEGNIFLLDRDSGEITLIDHTALDYSGHWMDVASLGLLSYYREQPMYAEDTRVNHWIRLEDGEPVDGPIEAPQRPVDVTRMLLSAAGRYAVYDLATLEQHTIYERTDDDATISIDDAGLVVRREPGGELVRIDYEGRSRVLARESHERRHITSDDRVITLHAVDVDGIGQLVIVEPDTLAEQVIDFRVAADSMSVEEVDGDVLVMYEVVDSDPSHNGIWLAKPAN
jgi:hypothetical protein